MGEIAAAPRLAKGEVRYLEYRPELGATVFALADGRAPNEIIARIERALK